MKNTTTHVGHEIARSLRDFGASHVFGVAGESFLPLLDGLFEYRDEIQYVSARHEAGASMMASAYGQVSGVPGVCMVTRGPGATQASVGLHVAEQDGSPLVLFVGQVPQSQLGSGAFQEMDYSRFFGIVAKKCYEIREAESAYGVTRRALNLARSGQPGPVVVVLPEDVLFNDVAGSPGGRVCRAAERRLSISDAQYIGTMVDEASRPVVVADVVPAGEAYPIELGDFARSAALPVFASARRQDVMENDHASYSGSLGFGNYLEADGILREADLLILIGSRPDGVIRSSLVDYITVSGCEVIHVHPAADVIADSDLPGVGVALSPLEFLRSLSGFEFKPEAVLGRSAWLRRARSVFEGRGPKTGDERLQEEFMEEFNRVMPSDVIITTGAGNYTAWPQAWHSFGTGVYPSQVGTKSGSMGFGLPAGISACLLHPNRSVVVFAGDGCFMMSSNELITASTLGLDLIVVIINNGRYGTIQDHQQRHYPGRNIGTSLLNPDFDRLAGAFDAKYWRVGGAGEFGDALTQAQGLSGLKIVEVCEALFDD